jgi:hypothetical protein
MPRTTQSRLKSRPHRMLPDDPLKKRIAQIFPSISHALQWSGGPVEDPLRHLELAYIKEELLVLLHRCHIFLRTTDSSASVAVQRANIETLLRLERPLTDQDFRELDDASQIRIGHQLDGGLLSTHSIELDDKSLRKAAIDAAKTLKGIPSGRPPWTESLARMQLALGLAMIFKSVTGMSPGRSVVIETGSRGNTIPSQEQGRFLAFIQVVVSALPKPLRRRLSPVQLARSGAKLIKLHPAGLIEESKFLG